MMVKKITYLFGAALLCSVVLLAGCATQNNMASSVGEASQSVAASTTLPDAKTYGLVDNKAPLQIPAPSSYNTQDVEKTVNSMDAPSNQTYYFNENSVTLNSDDETALKNQANYLITHPNAKVRLEGYSDSRGSRENNILLADKRLQTVQNVLLQYGVAPPQIGVVSFGKEKPAEDGFGEPVWAKNRRVQLVYEDQ
jgi:peptidoglycan-associated lipoprotein